MNDREVGARGRGRGEMRIWLGNNGVPGNEALVQPDLWDRAPKSAGPEVEERFGPDPCEAVGGGADVGLEGVALLQDGPRLILDPRLLGGLDGRGEVFSRRVLHALKEEMQVGVGVPLPWHWLQITEDSGGGITAPGVDQERGLGTQHI